MIDANFIMGLFLVLPFVLLLFSVVILFFSAWIVIPTPTLSFLPLGVVAPEVSPWLLILNGFSILLAIFVLSPGWLLYTILVCSLLGCGLSLLPLLQFWRTNQRFACELESALGENYLKEIPTAQQEGMRLRPLIFLDLFRSIILPDVCIERDIPFASPDDVTLTLNSYRPLNKGKHPAIIVIYGGAWRQGTPNDYERFSRYFASQGYSVIAIDYRHAPKYQFPAQLEDVETALTYILNHAEELDIDKERMAIMGRSAGAHLAMLAAYSSKVASFRAVVNYYGPINLTNGYYDLPSPDPLDIRTVLRDFLGGTPEELPKRYQEASPSNYVQANLPPSLLIYVGRDHLVQAKFGRNLYQQLQENDNLAVFLEIPWAEHAFDAVFFGISNQLALYYTERFLAWTLRKTS